MPGTRRRFGCFTATCLPGFGRLVCLVDNVNYELLGGRLLRVGALHHRLVVRHLTNGGSMRVD